MTTAELNPMPSRSIFLGVDVGTGSARAGLFDESGKLLGSSSSPIQIWKDGDCVEQSSTDIWHAVCAAVKAACSLANVSDVEVKGIGFAATCSLVAVDAEGSPVTVSWSGDSRRNIIVWMDHRAVQQAERINSYNSPVLQYCGGGVSPEMEPPKLLWVKENLQESWSMVYKWMDLSDWLSYRATGDDTRSLCTTVCKWTYLGHAHMHQMTEKASRDMEACGWDDEFWEEIGLGDLVDGHHAKIGRSVAFPGHPLGNGLTATAAKELGLLAGTPVGTSLIDAHAGGVGVMESKSDSDSLKKESDVDTLCTRMVLVCGTSTCHMAVSREKLFIPGVWGPFWSAMVPEYWLTEGGQSATGALLDHIIENHVASPRLANHAASQKVSVFRTAEQHFKIDGARYEFSIYSCTYLRHAYLCKPKEEGGLGLRSITEANNVSCLKLIWRILSAGSSLWVQWVKKYLIRKNSLWLANDKNSQGSWMWKKLLKYRTIASNLTRVSIISGTDASFWHDCWSQLGRLIDITGERGYISLGISLNATVESVLTHHRRRRHRQPVLNAIEDEIQRALAQVNDGKDIRLWKFKEDQYKDSFNTKNTMKLIRTSLPPVQWHRAVWFQWATPKFSIFLWLAILDRLGTGDRILRWYPMSDPLCCLCSSSQETRDHLFFQCAYSAEIWRNLAEKLYGRSFSTVWTANVNVTSAPSSNKIQLFLCRYVFQATAYSIWRERNGRKHGEYPVPASTLARNIDRMVRNRISSIAELGATKYEGLMRAWFASRPSTQT